LIAKKSNKKVDLTKIKPINDTIAIIIGKEIRVILFSLINDLLTLCRKNGHVAAK
jgi:hypothetical protein